MTKPMWTELSRNEDMLVLFSDESRRLHIPIQSVASWKVDWDVGGGLIEIGWSTGFGFTTVHFPAGDDGAACLAALAEIEAARRWQPERIGSAT